MTNPTTSLGGPGEQIAQLDQEILITQLQLDAMTGVEAAANSLPEILNVVSTMKDDLKGEAWELKDLVDVQPVDGEIPYVKMKEFDPLKVDGTQFPADLIATAVDKQEALTGMASTLTDGMKAFGENQSGLLSGMKQLQSGLTRGSDLFNDVESGIKRLQQANKLLEQVLDGEISDDKLMEAFADHLTLVSDVLEPLTKTIPGLGDFIKAYIDAVKALTPTVEKLRQHGLDQEHVKSIWDDVFRANDPSVTTTTAPATSDAPAESSSPIPALQARLDELRQQRIDLLTSWHKTLEGMAKVELAQLLAAAKLRLAAEGVTFLTPAESQAAGKAVLDLVQKRGEAQRKGDAEKVKELTDQISVAEAPLIADQGASERLEIHMVNVMREHPTAYGPSDLIYLREQVGGAVGRAADQLLANLPKDAVGPAGVPFQDPTPQGNPLENFLSRHFNSPVMAAAGLLGVVALIVVGFLLFGGGDDEPDLIAAGANGVATATPEATSTSEATATSAPTSAATEAPAFVELVPDHFSICPDGTVLSGPVKVDPSTGEPVLDGEGNRINGETDEPFVCQG